MTALMEPTEQRTPSGVRGLWKVFAAIMVLGAFVSGTFQIVTLLAHEERTEESSYPAAGIARIDVSNSTGSVRIVGTETDTIAVTAEISDGFRATGESQEVVGDTLELRGTCPNFGSDWCRVTYEIRVPAALDVHVDTDDGSIALDGLTGSLQATNDNGRIEGTNLRSETATADTENGRIELTFVAAPSNVRGDLQQRLGHRRRPRRRRGLPTRSAVRQRQPQRAGRQRSRQRALDRPPQRQRQRHRPHRLKQLLKRFQRSRMAGKLPKKLQT